MQIDKVMVLKKLQNRRNVLRDKLKKHFSLAISERDYKEFEEIVDELDGLRMKIRSLKGEKVNDKR
ncbi:MAG: hypothetical protein PHO59_02270 [Candidatus Omnitrophica bacterium]|nr:hypothetical protein [Candidatus Omnitrophota bacterium]